MKNPGKTSSVASVASRKAASTGDQATKSKGRRKTAAVKDPGSLHVPGSGHAPGAVPAGEVPQVVGQGPGSDQSRIHSTRFVTVLPAIPEEDLGLLPSMYDADRVFAIPRDPERVFATWDLSAATRRRVKSFGMLIRFVFDDGESDEIVSDALMPGSFQYYCAVPEGMVAVTAELAISNGSGLEVIASSGRVGLAIAFVRQGDPVFARVNHGVAPGREALVVAGTPAGLPDAEIVDGPDAGASARSKIGYMPVSGRK